MDGQFISPIRFKNIIDFFRTDREVCAIIFAEVFTVWHPVTVNGDQCHDYITMRSSAMIITIPVLIRQP